MGGEPPKCSCVDSSDFFSISSHDERFPCKITKDGEESTFEAYLAAFALEYEGKLFPTEEDCRVQWWLTPEEQFFC